MPTQLTHYIEADTAADADRHVIQRKTLIALLLDCADTKEYFTALMKSTGLTEAAQRVQLALSEPEEVLKAADQAMFDMVMINRKHLGGEISRLVHVLFRGITVPWIAAELLHSFLGQLQAFAYDGQLSRCYTATPTASQTITLSIPGGHTKRQMRSALLELLPQMTNKSRAGRRPKTEDKLVRHTEWYYLKVIGGVSIHRLAKNYLAKHPNENVTPDYEARALVQQYGIKLTAKRLGLPKSLPSHI